jgi:hypothetical protein
VPVMAGPSRAALDSTMVRTWALNGPAGSRFRWSRAWCSMAPSTICPTRPRSGATTACAT